MPSPLDLLDDSVDHGTLEGERAGCVTSACPASPLTCAEVAGSYRRDIKFKRLYTAGLRGQELFDVYTNGRPASAAPAATAEPAGPALTDPGPSFGLLEKPEQYRLLLEWRDQGLTFTAIGKKIGQRPASVGRMLTAASRMLEKPAAPALDTVPAPDGARDDMEPSAASSTAPAPDTVAGGLPAPVPASMVAARFGVPPIAAVGDIPGPQMRQMWVVLDSRKQVLAVDEDPAVAVQVLADAWTEQLRAEQTGARS